MTGVYVAGLKVWYAECQPSHLITIPPPLQVGGGRDSAMMKLPVWSYSHHTPTMHTAVHSIFWTNIKIQIKNLNIMYSYVRKNFSNH